MSAARYYREQRRSPARWWQFMVGGLIGALAVALIPPAPAVAPRAIGMVCFDTRPASDGYRLAASDTKKAPAMVCEGVQK
jgi:hypothetical protein